MKNLNVYYREDLCGILSKESETSYVFRYDSDYLKRGDARPISVNLPLRSEEFRSTQLFSFFDNLISEGWLLDAQVSVHKIDRNNRFELIARCGLECMGAVSLRGAE